MEAFVDLKLHFRSKEVAAKVKKRITVTDNVHLVPGTRPWFPLVETAHYANRTLSGSTSEARERERRGKAGNAIDSEVPLGSEAVLPDDDIDYLEDEVDLVPFDASIPPMATLGSVEEGASDEALAPEGVRPDTLVTGDEILDVEVSPEFGGSPVPRDREETHPKPIEQARVETEHSGAASSSSCVPMTGSAPAGAPCPVDPRVDSVTGALPGQLYPANANGYRFGENQNHHPGRC